MLSSSPSSRARSSALSGFSAFGFGLTSGSPPRFLVAAVLILDAPFKGAETTPGSAPGSAQSPCSGKHALLPPSERRVRHEGLSVHRGFAAACEAPRAENVFRLCRGRLLFAGDAARQ